MSYTDSKIIGYIESLYQNRDIEVLSHMPQFYLMKSIYNSLLINDFKTAIRLTYGITYSNPHYERDQMILCHFLTVMVILLNKTNQYFQAENSDSNIRFFVSYVVYKGFDQIFVQLVPYLNVQYWNTTRIHIGIDYTNYYSTGYRTLMQFLNRYQNLQVYRNMRQSLINRGFFYL